MCGIAGYFLNHPSKKTNQDIQVLLRSIKDRGPDDEGVCLISRSDKTRIFYKTDKTISSIGGSLKHINDSASIIPHDLALIHSRYAIIDLTEGGHQPFVSRDQSLVAVYNGEIYNYLQLREELSGLGVYFRTASDTEVLVEGYRVWGRQLWAKLNGFWAVAIYDRRNNSITLSRDRIGVAPLYYREMDNGFYFASSIQSLLDIDLTGIEVDEDKVLGFVQTAMKDLDNSTFYRQIKSIPPSTAVTFLAGQSKLEKDSLYQYWDFPGSRWSVHDLSFNEAVDRFREIFFNAVEIRLRADVKVACELSGGLDSSSVVAVAAMLRNNDVTTYTIKVPGRDEEPYARSILEKYPVDYRVLLEPEEKFHAESSNFTKLMEEPYHWPNVYTHYKMRQLMKSDGAYVVLAGAAGDEVFSGYEFAFWSEAYRDLVRNGHLWHALRYEWTRKFMTRQRSVQTIRNGIQAVRYYGLQPLRMIRDKWVGRVSVPSGNSSAEAYRDQYKEMSFHEQTLYHFKIAMMPYWMRCNDHFTMAIPVEQRFPFLDYRIVELGLQLPPSYLFKNGWTKYILRKAMEPYLPKKILWRKDKMGFPFFLPPFLMKYRGTFEPMIKNLMSNGFPIHESEPYDSLVRTNPGRLWRLCSVALWLDNQKGDQPKSWAF